MNLPSRHKHPVLSRLRACTKRRKSSSASAGFTLVELLVAGVISTIVILVAWSGLVSAMSTSQAAQSRSARQAELNRALDFMTNEIRTARSINQSATLTANGTTVSLNDVVTSAGVDLNRLGNYGTLGLYLERPIAEAPAICPAGGPNAGAPPPTPADFDPIVYDIRPSPSGWLQPRMVARYGRVPLVDGTINPCSSPVSSDPMIDALSITMNTPPTCAGVLSGAGGFYSCVEGNEAKLFFQSDVSKTEARTVSSTVASRVLQIQPATIPSTSCSLEGSLKRAPVWDPRLIRIINQKTIPIKTHWIDNSGSRVYMSTLAPGGSRQYNVGAGNPWVITDMSDQCLEIFVVPDAQNTSATPGPDSIATIQ